jgi:TIGR03009 family protein
MRSVGLSLLILSGLAVVGSAQPPAAAPGLPAAAPQADPVLDGHLKAWSDLTRSATNFSAKFELTRTDAVFKKQHKYSGSVLCMKPNLARFALGSTTNKNDFEAYICNGKSVFEYDWKAKTITEIPLVGGQGDNLMLDLLSGMNAAQIKQRFQLSQFQPNDPNYVYLDIKPVQPKDKQEFEHIRFALYGPNVPKSFTPYMPAQMYLMKPNGDSEMWVFSDQTLDVKGITPQVFQYEEPKDKGWQYKKAQLQPAPGPVPPKGGAVRP